MGFVINNVVKTNTFKSKYLYSFKNIIGKLKFLTITDIKVIDNLIYCSYNLTFALRIHHLPIVDCKYKLPQSIIDSFAFKHFSSPEKELISACAAYNNALEFRNKNPKFNTLKLSTGREIAVMVYNPNDPTNFLEFKISDLSKFTGLCRRYRTPMEVERIIKAIFEKDNNV